MCLVACWVLVGVVDGSDGGGEVPMMVWRSSHVCRWNSSSVEASIARSTSVRLNGGGSSTPSCEATILQVCGVESWRVGDFWGVLGTLRVITLNTTVMHSYICKGLGPSQICL